MTAAGPADHGYLILDRRGLGQAPIPAVEAAFAALVGQGWRASPEVEGLQILLGPRARLKVRQVGRRHLLIGDWGGASAPPLSTLVAVNARAGDLAQAVVGAGWGRYILAWRDAAGDLALLRDPTGALDCVWWRCGGAVLAASEPPRAVDPLLPADLAIDWTVLREIAEAPELLGDRLALTGLNAVNPGTLALISRAAASVPVWRPSAFCSSRTGWDESRGGLVEVVDATVATLTDRHRRVVAELSGGLDSAVVASSLAATGGAGRARFLNFYGDWREGDERPWAEAVAGRLELDLTTVRKPVEGISLRQLRPLGESVRPALQGVDVTYDAQVAARMRRSRATALVTGQGGDAVFFQAPDPAVAADRFRRDGLAGLSPAFLAAVGRWTRHSAWTVLGVALGLRTSGPRPAAGRRHPWLEDIEDLPPAKAGQLRQFVNAQLFWGDCLRARAGDLLHPLLSQPVAEHCLAIPADRLIAGVRDRGLARQAFAERLPPRLIERRSKGDLSCFYGHVTRASLATLKPLLLDGLQVDQGLLDGKTLERDLREDRLIVGPGYNRLLVGAVLEVWAQHWEARIADVRRARAAAALSAAPAPPPSNGTDLEGSQASCGSEQGPDRRAM
ncbi:MAG: asparagine synthase-related protein [Brevundimonas sp.]